MARLNLNSMLNSVSVNDMVVIERQGTGSQLAVGKAPELLSMGWPKPIGPEPTPDMGTMLAMHMRYRDDMDPRTGRSEACPSAGLVPCDSADQTALSAIPEGWLAINPGSFASPKFFAKRQLRRS